MEVTTPPIPANITVAMRTPNCLFDKNIHIVAAVAATTTVNTGVRATINAASRTGRRRAALNRPSPAAVTTTELAADTATSTPTSCGCSTITRSPGGLLQV